MLQTCATCATWTRVSYLKRNSLELNMEAKEMRQGKVVYDIEQMLSMLGYNVIYDKTTSSLGHLKGGFNRKFAVYKK